MNGVRAWLNVSISFPRVLLDLIKSLKLLPNVLYCTCRQNLDCQLLIVPLLLSEF